MEKMSSQSVSTGNEFGARVREQSLVALIEGNDVGDNVADGRAGGLLESRRDKQHAR